MSNKLFSVSSGRCTVSVDSCPFMDVLDFVLMCCVLKAHAAKPVGHSSSSAATKAFNTATTATEMPSSCRSTDRFVPFPVRNAHTVL